jgi:hypothetical protein
VSFDHEADRAERYPDGLDGNVQFKAAMKQL